MVRALGSFATLAAATGLPERAARLFGAVEAAREVRDFMLWRPHRSELERAVSATRAQFDELAFARAWADGRAMTPEQAIAYALEAVG